MTDMLETVRCIVTTPGDSVLLLHKAEGAKLAGLYEFPGGTFDAKRDGSLAQAAARELREETHIVVAPADLMPVLTFNYGNIGPLDDGIRREVNVYAAELPVMPPVTVCMGEWHDSSLVTDFNGYAILLQGGLISPNSAIIGLPQVLELAKNSL